jgi:uncharacterized phage-associated protein
MKLQKLLFYGHAWYLAIHDRPLFDENIEAWPWGPIVRDVYYQTRHYGRDPVKSPIRKLFWDPTAPLNSRFEEPDVNDGPIKSFIKQIWEVHKPYTGVQLSNSTHAPGEPWKIIKEQFQTLDAKPTIPNDLIAAVFKRKLENARAA